MSDQELHAQLRAVCAHIADGYRDLAETVERFPEMALQNVGDVDLAMAVATLNSRVQAIHVLWGEATALWVERLPEEYRWMAVGDADA